MNGGSGFLVGKTHNIISFSYKSRHMTLGNSLSIEDRGPNEVPSAGPWPGVAWALRWCCTTRCLVFFKFLGVKMPRTQKATTPPILVCGASAQKSIFGILFPSSSSLVLSWMLFEVSENPTAQRCRPPPLPRETS